MRHIRGYKCKCPYCGTNSTFEFGEKEFECPNCNARTEIVETVYDEIAEDTSAHMPRGLKRAMLGVIIAAAVISALIMISNALIHLSTLQNSSPTTQEDELYKPGKAKTNAETEFLDYPEDKAGVYYGEDAYTLKFAQADIVIPRPSGLQLESHYDIDDTDYPRISFRGFNYKVDVTYQRDVWNSIEEIMSFSEAEQYRSGEIGGRKYIYTISSMDTETFITIHQDIGMDRPLEIDVILDNVVVSDKWIESLLLPKDYFVAP